MRNRIAYFNFSRIFDKLPVACEQSDEKFSLGACIAHPLVSDEREKEDFVTDNQRLTEYTYKVSIISFQDTTTGDSRNVRQSLGDRRRHE